MVFAGVSLLFLCAAWFLFPGPPGAVGEFASAPGRVPPEAATTVTVDGAIDTLKLSPSGRHVHGFYLDDGTEVNLPPHAHEAYAGEVGQRVEVTGTLHTNLTGENLVNAASITDSDTGATLDIVDIDNAIPHAKGGHAKGKT